MKTIVLVSLVLCLYGSLVQACYIRYHYTSYPYEDVVTVLNNHIEFGYGIGAMFGCDDLVLRLNWWIGGTKYLVANLSLSSYDYYYYDYNSDNVSQYLEFPGNITIYPVQCSSSPWHFYCETYLYIKAIAVHNNSVVYTEAYLSSTTFSNTSYSSPISIIIQGLLEAPPNLHVVELSTDNIEITWEPPFTIPGVPILSYTMYINNHATPEELSVSTASTQYTFPKPCGSLTFSVSAWNYVGEGVRSEPVTYLRKTLHSSYMSVSAPVDLPGSLCVSCSFAEDSKAQGCFAGLHKVVGTLASQIQSFNIIREGNQLSVIHCITGLDTGTYTVRIGEIECTGLQGPMTHVEWYNVSVSGIPKVTTPAPNVTTTRAISNPTGKSTGNTDSAVTSLGVITALLGVALAVCLVVIVAFLVYMRKHRNYHISGTDVATRPVHPQNVGSAAIDEECTYEKVEHSDYEIVQMQPVPPPQHTQHKQATGRKPSAKGAIGIEPCVAYGLVRR